MQYYGMTLGLRDDPALIERYRAEHRQVWPDVIARLRESCYGVTALVATSVRFPACPELVITKNAWKSRPAAANPW